MFFLNTDSCVTKVLTRFVSNGAANNSDEFATMMVSFDDTEYLCKVLSPYAPRSDRGIAPTDTERAEWLELTSNHDLVLRNATLYAVPSKNILGAGSFALGMIDLCLDDDSESRYYVIVLAID